MFHHLSEWLIQNGRHFPDEIFKCIFLNENAWIPVMISLKFGQINNIPASDQIMAWRRSGDKPLSEWWLVYWRINASFGLNELKQERMNRHTRWRARPKKQTAKCHVIPCRWLYVAACTIPIKYACSFEWHALCNSCHCYNACYLPIFFYQSCLADTRKIKSIVGDTYCVVCFND